MSSWQTKKLGDVLDKIEGGGTPSKEKREYWHGSIPWASVKDLTNFNRLKTQDYITEEGLANSSSKLVQAGTLITPTRMALGFTVQFDVDVAINQDLKALYPNKSVHNSFLKYWFEANRKKIEKLGVGSTVAGIQVSELRAQKINLPEKAEQERIVGVLEVWDEYIEKLEQKIALKEQLKKGLMQQLLTGKRRLPGFIDEWEQITLGEVGKVSMCKRIFNNQTFESGDIPFYKISTFGKIADSYISRELYEEYKQNYSYPSPGDILISASGTIGRTVVYDGHPGYYQDSNIIWISNDEKKVLNRFLFYVYKYVKWETASGTVARLYNDNVRRVKFKKPPIDEQLKIASILDVLGTEIDLLSKKRHELLSQKNFLLKNLITGTISTPETIKPKGASS